MPTYDYTCTKCGDRFEHFQKMTDPPLDNCTKCKGKLRRLIGKGISPIFRGSGFYQTDYKQNKNESVKETVKTPAKETKNDSGQEINKS